MLIWGKPRHLALISGMAALAPSVLAQPAEPPETAATETNQEKAVQLEAVKVTGERVDDAASSLRLKDSSVATKLSAEVLETPASISTVTEKMLDDRAIRQADKALVFVPGVSYSGSAG